MCELSLLTRADGSAKWTQEGTCVVAAVYGPRQAQQRKEDAEKAVIEVVFKPRSGLQGARLHAQCTQLIGSVQHWRLRAMLDWGFFCCFPCKHAAGTRRAQGPGV